MPKTKQAKILTKPQQQAVLTYLDATKHTERNTVFFLLSLDAALRAKEIADLKWTNVTDADNQLTDRIELPNSVSKGKSGGVIYMSKRLRQALLDYQQIAPKSEYVAVSNNMKKMSAQVVTNWFFNLYRSLGFSGCSSHSGRRTAITKWAREISKHSGSIRDVQSLARHASLQMTQSYIEINEDAKKLVVN